MLWRLYLPAIADLKALSHALAIWRAPQVPSVSARRCSTAL